MLPSFRNLGNIEQHRYLLGSGIPTYKRCTFKEFFFCLGVGVAFNAFGDQVNEEVALDCSIIIYAERFKLHSKWVKFEISVRFRLNKD